jgi:hypothetical protein
MQASRTFRLARIGALVGVLIASAFIARVNADTSTPTMHRYLVERTFPKGALDKLDAATKAKVNETNSKFGVKWVTSYANDDKTKTYCIYEGPSADSIREAAKANGMNANTVTEVPVTLDPK